jgi:hypothetical protein
MISGLEIAAGCVVHVMAAAAGVAQADAIRVLGAGCEVLGAVPGAWCWVPCLGAGCVPCLALNAAARRRRH